ncbi:MAG TPA: aminopeptidase [Pelolinea sp.]|nr:aminopeptidase [Pelolinea sp.]
MDKRWKHLGDLLVNYSMEVKPGEKVMIAMKELEAYPLTHAIYEATIKAGAYPQVQFISEELNHLILEHGSMDQVRWVPEVEMYGMEWADAYFGLRAAHNLNTHWNISSERLSAHRKSMGTVSTARWEKTRWCLLRLPNAALADQAGVDQETITDMWFNACLLDWPEVSKEWKRWAEMLNIGKQVRVVGRETDLTFSVEGRTWEVADGRGNMPDGEIATSPVTYTVNGHIYFDFPGVLGGRLVHDIRLCWEDGKLVEATSSTNQDFLTEVVNSDEGASKIGEFAIGTNDEVKHFCRDILIDEKIGGTIHIALGRAYPKTGGLNKSAIHWDIIKDMREFGEIYLDGKSIFKDGKVLL